MIIGSCPYCHESFWLEFPPEYLNGFARHECGFCHQFIFTRLSTIVPESFTQAQFDERFEVDEEAGRLKERTIGLVA